MIILRPNQALFGVSGYDGYDEMDNYLHMQDQQRQQQQEVEEMRRQFEEQRGREEGVRYPDDMFAGESFFDHSGDRRFTNGQEFEQYHDFEAGGVWYGVNTFLLTLQVFALSILAPTTRNDQYISCP